MTPKAQVNAQIATLVDHFKMSMSDIGRLTDRQIRDIYFHPRTKEGGIEPVEERRSGSVEADLHELDMLIVKGIIRPTAEEKNILQEKIRKKWQDKSK